MRLTSDHPCGTSERYMQHYRRHEPIDDLCREAHNRAMNYYHKARKELAERHPEEYQQILNELTGA